MYFIEHLCDMAQRENHLDFVRMMQRDILRVVDAVAPSDGSGAANVKVVRRVRLSLQFFYCATHSHSPTLYLGSCRSPAKDHPNRGNGIGN